YYSAIGLGFMLLEIVLVQRTVLFLGHPTASVATTLAALLVGSGIGSALSGRPAGRARPVATVVLAIALGLAWMLALELTRAALADGALALPIAARAFVVVLAVAPLGVALGVPFPAGTRVLVGAGEVAPSRLAWALGVNGFAGTLASLVAVPVAMVTGFRVVTWTAAAFYAIAAAVVVLVGISRSRRSARPSKP
ncbi:MAG: SAM-dependent methyltransferase, partial [Deltaproteobacteria bacterium]|nr:SAM-dependent methyltransferase [Deltaproteobacteria bacterium]